MKRELKDHFIPHEGNDYQPHFLGFKITLVILASIFVLEGFYLLGTFVILPHSKNFAAVFATVLVEQTNKERVSGELGELRPSARLEVAAKLKAEDMASKGYFSHNSPDGKTPWYWFREAGYDYAAAGENLAVNFTDSKDVTEAWMRSPTHRANIMSGNYTEIGIATAQGSYKGKSAIFVVQEFGRPSTANRQIRTASSTITALRDAVSANVSGVSDVALVKVAGASSMLSPASSTQRLTVVTPAVALVETVATASERVASMGVPTTTVVAGADTTRLDVPQATFAETVAEPAVVVPPAPTPSKLDVLIASPRQATTTIFLILGAVLTLALGLAIFIKIRVQYAHIIANGVLLISIILALLLLNYALGFTQGAI